MTATEYQLQSPFDGPTLQATLLAAYQGTTRYYTKASPPLAADFTGPFWQDKELWWSDGTHLTRVTSSDSLTTIYDKAVAAALVIDPAYVAPTIEDWFNAQASGGTSYLAPVADATARTALTAVEGSVVYQEDTGHTWTFEANTWNDRGGSLGGVNFLAPVDDSVARLALTPNEGDLVFQKDTGHTWAYETSAWVDKGGNAGGGIIFIPPAADKAAREALTPVEGNTIVQEDTGHIWSYESGVWVDKGAGAGVSFASHVDTKAGTSKTLAVTPDSLRNRLAVVEAELKIASGPAPTDTHALVSVDAANNSLELRVDNETGIEVYSDKAPSTKWQPTEINSLVRKDYVDVLANTIWDGTKDYVKGDLASTYDTLYIATGPSNGEQPLPTTASLPTSNWTPIAPKPKADLWDPQVQYDIGDIISLDYKLYVAIGATKGNPPATDTSYWRKYHSETSWNSEHVYGIGDLATQNNKIYISLTDNQNNVSPDANPADWLESSFDDTKLVQSIARNRKIIDALQHEVDAMSDNDAWNKGESYKAGDVTSRKGIAYIAVVDSKAVDPEGNTVEWKAISYDDSKLQVKVARIRAILHDLQDQVDANEPYAWDNTLAYNVGDLSTLNGVVYIALVKNKATDPASSSSHTTWVVVGRDIDDSDIADDKIWSSKQIVDNMDGVYKLLGEWDASNNIPALADGDVLPTGSYFIVTADGTVNTGTGDVDYAVGDHIYKSLSGFWQIGGTEGKSAYAIAIDDGFVGTEAEWLDSLIGGTRILGNDTFASIMLKTGVKLGESWIVSDTGVTDNLDSGGVVTTAGHVLSVTSVNPTVFTNIGYWSGPEGIQGIDGIGINTLPPVVDKAALDALGATLTLADTGNAVLQTDTGEFWVWHDTLWADAGHLTGPQGPRGNDGKNAFQVAKSVDKTILDKTKWLESLRGDSAYAIAVAGGFSGTEPEWVASLTGATGVSLSVLPPVADIAARDLLGVAYTIADAGTAVLTVDMGQFWVWDGASLSWMDASSLIGPTGASGSQGITGKRGIQGPQGIVGVQGVAGADGVSINVKPPVADEAERLAITPLVPGDSVVQLDTGEFWVRTATAWVDGGAIKGPIGPQGVVGPASTAPGPPGADGKDSLKVRVSGNTLFISTDGSQP